MKTTNITTLFLDIGGVLLSNGWGREFRYRAAEKFNIEIPEMEKRHSLMFVTFEEGRIKLDDYLNRVVFFKKRDFTVKEFSDFMYSQTTPNSEMIEFIKSLKLKYGLKIVAVSNEARELNAYRIQKFLLNSFIDFFITSSHVQLRKPDTKIFQLAIDCAQVPVNKIIYIDDVKLFIDVATDLGINSIHHIDLNSTAKSLGNLGLKLN